MNDFLDFGQEEAGFDTMPVSPSAPAVGKGTSLIDFDPVPASTFSNPDPVMMAFMQPSFGDPASIYGVSASQTGALSSFTIPDNDPIALRQMASVVRSEMQARAAQEVYSGNTIGNRLQDPADEEVRLGVQLFEAWRKESSDRFNGTVAQGQDSVFVPLSRAFSAPLKLKDASGSLLPGAAVADFIFRMHIEERERGLNSLHATTYVRPLPFAFLEDKKSKFPFSNRYIVTRTSSPTNLYALVAFKLTVESNGDSVAAKVVAWLRNIGTFTGKIASAKSVNITTREEFNRFYSESNLELNVPLTDLQVVVAYMKDMLDDNNQYVRVRNDAFRKWVAKLDAQILMPAYVNTVTVLAMDRTETTETRKHPFAIKEPSVMVVNDGPGMPSVVIYRGERGTTGGSITGHVMFVSPNPYNPVTFEDWLQSSGDDRSFSWIPNVTMSAKSFADDLFVFHGKREFFPAFAKSISFPNVEPNPRELPNEPLKIDRMTKDQSMAAKVLARMAQFVVAMQPSEQSIAMDYDAELALETTARQTVLRLSVRRRTPTVAPILTTLIGRRQDFSTAVLNVGPALDGYKQLIETQLSNDVIIDRTMLVPTMLWYFSTLAAGQSDTEQVQREIARYNYELLRVSPNAIQKLLRGGYKPGLNKVDNAPFGPADANKSTSLSQMIDKFAGDKTSWKAGPAYDMSLQYVLPNGISLLGDAPVESVRTSERKTSVRVSQEAWSVLRTPLSQTYQSFTLSTRPQELAQVEAEKARRQSEVEFQIRKAREEEEAARRALQTSKKPASPVPTSVTIDDSKERAQRAEAEKRARDADTKALELAAAKRAEAFAAEVDTRIFIERARAAQLADESARLLNQQKLEQKAQAAEIAKALAPPQNTPPTPSQPVASPVDVVEKITSAPTSVRTESVSVGPRTVYTILPSDLDILMKTPPVEINPAPQSTDSVPETAPNFMAVPSSAPANENILTSVFSVFSEAAGFVGQRVDITLASVILDRGDEYHDEVLLSEAVDSSSDDTDTENGTTSDQSDTDDATESDDELVTTVKVVLNNGTQPSTPLPVPISTPSFATSVVNSVLASNATPLSPLAGGPTAGAAAVATAIAKQTTVIPSSSTPSAMNVLTPTTTVPRAVANQLAAAVLPPILENAVGVAVPTELRENRRGTDIMSIDDLESNMRLALLRRGENLYERKSAVYLAPMGETPFGMTRDLTNRYTVRWMFGVKDAILVNINALEPTVARADFKKAFGLLFSASNELMVDMGERTKHATDVNERWIVPREAYFVFNAVPILNTRNSFTNVTGKYKVGPEAGTTRIDFGTHVLYLTCRPVPNLLDMQILQVILGMK